MDFGGLGWRPGRRVGSMRGCESADGMALFDGTEGREGRERVVGKGDESFRAV